MALLYITVFTLCVLRGQRCVPSPLSLSVSFNVWPGMCYLRLAASSCLRPACFSKQDSIYYKMNYKELSWRVCVMGCSSKLGMNCNRGFSFASKTKYTLIIISLNLVLELVMCEKSSLFNSTGKCTIEELKHSLIGSSFGAMTVS